VWGIIERVTDYALHRMNSREFEHVSQALLLKTFGAAVEIFGDGADNGREAVYSGTLVALPVLECVDAFLELAGVDQ